jgi:plastocyanin
MGRVLATIITALLLAAAPALAGTITARAPNQFGSAVTTIDQGESVDFRNLDIAGHDVTSSKKSEDGKPLFRSELISPQSSGPVVGTEYLVTGTYPFVCTVHPGMEATLKVSSAGTPKPRPNPPKISIKIVSGDIQQVAADGRLKLAVQATKGEVKVSAKTKGAKLGSKTVTFKSAGKRTVTLRVSKSARKVLSGRNRTKVTATAAITDAAGQAAKATATRTLK